MGRGTNEVRVGELVADDPLVAGLTDCMLRARVALYSAIQDRADGEAFVKRGRDDRHQFRFIVAPEDGVEPGSLRRVTRSLMDQMEEDLGTRLDWMAVDQGSVPA